LVLQDFRVLPAPHCRPQEASYRWLAAAHAHASAKAAGCRDATEQSVDRMERRVRYFGCSPEHIGFRRSELEDFTHTDWHRMRIFNLNGHSESQALRDRNDFFSRVAERRIADFFDGEGDPPSDLLHVTCTGYASPSAVQRLIELKGWHGRTRATHAYHMGCYAAVPALRIAAGLSSFPQDGVPSRVEIVHTELCTLHFNPGDHSPEQLVIQSLFADGHARYTLVPNGAPGERRGFELLAVREETVPDSLGDMTWVVSDQGFRMTLSRDVPGKIAAALAGFLGRILQASGAGPDAAGPSTVFAIHPGGPRIIDSVQELLRLEDRQIAHSRTVLFEFGNLSSATLPHIWARVCDDPGVASGTPVVSIAFGPGLTVAGAVFRKC
jgi:predicted naringenin-chalcone synthase